MPLPSTKKDKDFEKVRVWEYSETWNNPFSNEDQTTVDDDDDEDDVDNDYLQGNDRRSRSTRHNEKKKSSSGKKKRSSRRKHKKVSAEESSQADSLLSSILSESELEDVERFMPAVTEVLEDEEDEDEDCDSMNVLASVRPVVTKIPSSSPRTRRERPQPLSAKQVLSFDEEELGRRHRPIPLEDDSMHVHAGNRGDNSSLEDHGAVAGEDDDDVVVSDDDDTNILNPFSGMDDLIKKKPSTDSNNKAKSNPFDDDDNSEEADSVATDDDNVHIEATLKEEQGVIEITPLSKSMDAAGSDEEEEQEEQDDIDEDEEEEEDIVESSKRLLRMCDERIQYQHHNEEVQTLKATVDQMKNQAEAMAEQLRRAVETKCDLVLAQNEMERRHEQVLISKDHELKDMRMYIQEILDMQAKSELNFMNEISSLARKLEIVEEKRLKESKEKDNMIAQLESKVMDLQTGSVRGNSSRRSFRGRFTDSSSSIGSHSTTSKQSLSARNRQKVHPF
jgi:hypothetical protein